MNKKNLRQEKGITLIALVITIIVMLILAAISINIALNGGLFEYAGKAGKETRLAALEEQLYTAYMSQIMADYANGTNNASLANAIAQLNLNGEYVIESIPTSEVANITLSEDITNITIGTDDETKTYTFTATPVGDGETTNYYVVEGEKYYKIKQNENGKIEIEREPSVVNNTNSTLSIEITNEGIATGSITGNTVTITGKKVEGNTAFKVKCGNVEKTGTINAVIKSTITFNANGGKFANNSQTTTVTGTAGETANFPTAPTRDGYAFTGWYEATDGNDIVYIGEESTITIPNTSTEVFAHWQMDLTNSALSVGTEVYLTGVPSEKFYVIEASSAETATVKLLAKYNVKTNATPYAQNSSANTVRFDDNSSDYNATGCEIKALVDDYVSGTGTSGGSSNCKLNLTLGTGEEARLLLKSEIDVLAGGDTSNSTNYFNLPSWAKDRSYWLGSAYDSDYVWDVRASSSVTGGGGYHYAGYFGVRPVLIVSKSRLSLSE